MRFSVLMLFPLLFGVSSCSTLKENPNPIASIPYERTSRLQELRAGLQEKNSRYLQEKGDRLDRNTNKRQYGELKDEYARWDMRAQEQIERELVKRYQAGENAAQFPGMERYLEPAAASIPNPAPTPTSAPNP
ncbi:MAG: hypothetical protein SFU85_09250 [Candidatus Methylacidiphilales bacterium]|nr:hypothetical protein [Candidatus Methylacidiphilales bacterium]